MSFLKKIQILAGDVIDLKPKLKEKKAEDKEKKQESIKPDFSKAQVRVTTSSAYAGGFELSVSVQVPAEFIKDKKKDNKGEFVTLLHEYVEGRIGKWLGTPTIGGFQDRAKNGMLTIKATWHFEDAYYAYALGLNLDEWRSSADVVEKHQIAARQALAEKAMKELDGFRSLAQKKLKLRSRDGEEQSKIWQEEFKEDWMKLDQKWREKGICYTELKHSEGGRERAVGFTLKSKNTKEIRMLNKVAAKYKIISKNAKLEDTVNSMMANTTFLRALPDMLQAAKSGIQVGHIQDSPMMVKFNALVVHYLESIHKKDAAAALKAAEELVKEGHGDAFGLK
jgi:hypothetical protein